MAARAVCESPPAIQQPVALNDNNNVINTMMSAIGIGRDGTRPREATTVHVPVKRCRNDSTQATGRKIGISNSTHTANPSRVPSAMPFMMFYPFLLNHTSAWKTAPVYFPVTLTRRGLEYILSPE